MKCYPCLILIIAMMTFGNLEGFSASSQIKLPSPKRRGTVSLEEALNKRQSRRSYKKEPLNLEDVSQLLWAAYGNNKSGKLTAPSAGALYPITIYALIGDIKKVPAGLYKYNSREHSLSPVKAGDLRLNLSRASLGQPWVREAPFSIIICADYSITASRYGKRAQRYVDIEVGHIGQNIYLQAEALNLGTVAVGAFSDEEVKRVLGTKEEPLYIMPVGKIK